MDNDAQTIHFSRLQTGIRGHTHTCTMPYTYKFTTCYINYMYLYVFVKFADFSYGYIKSLTLLQIG